MQRLEEPACFFSRDGLQLNFGKALRMNMISFSSDVECETALTDELRNYLSTDGVYEVAEGLKPQAEEKCN